MPLCDNCGKQFNTSNLLERFVPKFQIRLRTALLMFVVISVILAFPIRRWNNVARYNETCATVRLWMRSNLDGFRSSTSSVNFGGEASSIAPGVREREFQIDAHKYDANALVKEDLSFTIFVSLAPFPSLEGPKIVVKNARSNKSISLSELNSSVARNFGFDELDF